ncbi:MAG: Lar family restriction alleviation protein [Bacillota bacterium]|nr:Lar family restriction alleviation protein [Bacillota bacterium]
MSELKACPFCGGKARIMLEEEDRLDDFFHNVYCTNCGATVWAPSEKDAIAAWSRRTEGEGRNDE